MQQKTIFTKLLAAILFVLILGAAGLVAVPNAYALSTDSYTPGEDYYIDEPEAFWDQGIDHQGTDDNEASTQYYLTSPFYLNWISPDLVIREGESAYIGCGATGLNDLTYEWYVSIDGGKTFTETGLIGNEHTLYDLTANSPEEMPFLYRCIITNGDQTSTLEADVSITVLAAEKTPSEVIQESAKSFLPKTGDSMIPLIFLAISLLAALLAVLLRAKLAGKSNQDNNES